MEDGTKRREKEEREATKLMVERRKREERIESYLCNLITSGYK